MLNDLPKSMKTTNRSAFSVFELLIVIVTVMLVAAVILPHFGRSRPTNCRLNCANNLKQVGLAFRTWALDNNDKYPMAVSTNQGGSMELIDSGYAFPHFRVMSNELSTPKILICPDETDSWRVPANTFAMTNPPSSATSISFTNDNNLSYFAGVDATQENPNMTMTGDHWLSLNGKSLGHGLHTITNGAKVAWSKSPSGHNGGGNLGLADGSVVQITSGYLPQLFMNQSTNHCRLAFP